MIKVSTTCDKLTTVCIGRVWTKIQVYGSGSPSQMYSRADYPLTSSCRVAGRMYHAETVPVVAPLCSRSARDRQVNKRLLKSTRLARLAAILARLIGHEPS